MEAALAQETRIFDQKYPQEKCRTVLEQTLKEGATKLLQQAIEEEVESYMRKKIHLSPKPLFSPDASRGLAKELISYLFAKCEVKELLACRQTSTYMQNLVRKAFVTRMNLQVSTLFFLYTQALFSLFSENGQPVGDAQNVIRLDLSNSRCFKVCRPIDEEEVAQTVQWFPNVQSLSMHGTAPRSNGLSSLSVLNLTELDVSGSWIGDEEVGVIGTSFQNLRSLDLHGTEITSEGLTSLSGLNLTYLQLPRLKFASNDRAAIQKKFKSCQVILEVG